MLLDLVAPRHPVYQALGTPRHTRSHLSPSGPSDQLADPANHSRRISSTAIQRLKTFRCTGEPCARSHRSNSRSLSHLLPAILSLSSDLPFPAVWSLPNTTERFLASNKAKARPFSAFYPPYMAGKRPRFSSATEASNRRFSLFSHQRPSIPPPSESSPSYLPESTILWPEISPENFTAPTVTARGPHAPPVAFS